MQALQGRQHLREGGMQRGNRPRQVDTADVNPLQDVASPSRLKRPRARAWRGLLRWFTTTGQIPLLWIFLLIVAAYHQWNFTHLSAPSGLASGFGALFKECEYRGPSRSTKLAMNFTDGEVAPEKRYVDALVCKGFCNQLAALADSVAVAFLLNATLVLPRFYTGYDYHSLDGINPGRANYDMQALLSVPASRFFDTDALTEALKPHIEVVEHLPWWLEADAGFSRLHPVIVNPKSLDSLEKYQQQIGEHQVLRLNCLLNTVHWSSEGLRTLRTDFLNGLRPSAQVAEDVKSQLSKSGLGDGQPFTFVHLRTEEDWWDYCRREVAKPHTSQVQTIQECYVSAGAAAAYLERLGGDPRMPVYVAGGNVTDSDLQEFRRSGFSALARGIQGGSLTKRDTDAAAEWFLARAAATVVGNVFSSFDWLLREARAVSTEQRGARTYYYNRSPNYTEGQLQVTETLRWRISPFPGWPASQGAGNVSREGQVDVPCQTPAACPCSELKQLKIEEVNPTDSGFVKLRITFDAPCKLCIFRVKIYADSYLVGDEISNIIEPSQSPTSYVAVLETSVPVSVAAVRPVKFKACCHGEDAVNPKCSQSKPGARVRPALQFWNPSKSTKFQQPGRILFYLPFRLETGGPEALHQLHNTINQLHYTGFIGMKSSFSNGNPAYKTEFSHFIGSLQPWDVRPQDVLILPEAYLGEEIKGIADVVHAVGALPIVWYLGQFIYSTSQEKSDKPGFRPLCLTNYFAVSQACPPKAVINTPMGSRFVEDSEKWRSSRTPKENLVLYDPDEGNFFDPSRLKLPPRTQLVKLSGYTREQVISLYKRAKAIIDPYITGCERALFEGILFGVVPIVAYHGPARDISSFPIPREWTWQLWDYDQLNRLVEATVNQHAMALQAFQPLFNHTIQLEQNFVLQTSNYFADDVLFVFSALCSSSSPPGCAVSSTEDRSKALLAALAAIAGHPFADAEILVDNREYMYFEYGGFLEGLISLGQTRAFAVTELLPEYRRFLSSAIYFQTPETPHRRQFAMLMPPGAMSLSPGLVARMIRHARQHGLAMLRHTASGLLLVEWSTYFRKIQGMLPHFLGSAGPDEVMEMMRRLGLPTGEFGEMPGGVVRIGDEMRCVKGLHCKALTDILNGPMWRSTTSRIPYTDASLTWMSEVQRFCAAVVQ